MTPRGVRPAAAALGLLALAVGCDDGSPAASPSPPAGSFTSGLPTATASARLATAGPTPAAGSTDFGYFPGVASTSPTVVPEFDRALFLTGAAADRASAAHGGDDSIAPKRHTLTDLLGFLRTGEGPRTPWHLTYGTGGRVSRVEEQYIP